MFDGRYTRTPELGLGLTEASRETLVGWRLSQARSAGLVFGLDVEAARREPVALDAEPEHRLGFGFGWSLHGARREDFEVGAGISRDRHSLTISI